MEVPAAGFGEQGLETPAITYGLLEVARQGIRDVVLVVGASLPG
jgi:hypothetical protein